MRRSLQLTLASLLTLAAVLAIPTPSEAGEISIFVGEVRPEIGWGRTYGGALTGGFFRLVALEGEMARYPGIADEESMTTFSGSAFLAPPIGVFTPYGGFGVGVFRQSIGDLTDNGTFKLFALGVKLRLGIVVVRGECRWLDITGDLLPPIDKRYTAGLGIAF